MKNIGRRAFAAGLLAVPPLAAPHIAKAAETPIPAEGIGKRIKHLSYSDQGGRPDGVQVDIHFVVVPALARNKQPDAVLLLAGGPGVSASRFDAGGFRFSQDGFTVFKV